MPELRIRVTPIHLACAAVVLVGLALGLYKVYFPPGPTADEATYVMIAQSLWHDRDLTYDSEDLARAYQLWDQGPYGLILFTTDGGETMRYGKPYVYSMAALPFYAVFGVQGFLVLNMLLLLGMVAAGWWVLQRESAREDAAEGAGKPGFVGLYVVGFFFASAVLGYVFWMQPEIFNMACVFFPLVIWRSLRGKEVLSGRDYLLLAGGGALLAAAFVSKEPTVLLGAPIALDFLWQRAWSWPKRFQAVGALALPALIALVCLVGVQWKLTERWSPYRDSQRRSFENAYPTEVVGGDPWQLYRGTFFGSWNKLPVETNPRVWANNLGYFLVGRHTGVLPYFPFALFAVGLFLFGAGKTGPRSYLPTDRAGWLLLAAVVAYCLVLLAVRSHNFHGGSGFIGNRYFASVYPALLLLPGVVRARQSLLLPFAVAALWIVPVVAVPVQRIANEFGLQVHTRTPAFQALPLELTLVGDGKIPGYWSRGWGNAVWVVPKHNFFAREQHPKGVWVRGSSYSEVILVSPTPMDSLRLTVESLSPRNVLTLESGKHRLRVRFDSQEKRQGTPVVLPLGRPIARNLDSFFPGQDEYYYHLKLTTTDGVVPQRVDLESEDLRYLGVFLNFSGEVL